jgi:DNA repair protein RecO (recombination protein O)
MPPHNFVIEPPQSQIWYHLITCSFENLEELNIHSTNRKLLLEYLLDYYRLHTENFGEIRSQTVLAELFS